MCEVVCELLVGVYVRGRKGSGSADGVWPVCVLRSCECHMMFVYVRVCVCQKERGGGILVQGGVLFWLVVVTFTPTLHIYLSGT